MSKLIKNPRKGISIFELMTALATIMIIMIASISLLKSSSSISVRSSAIIEANDTVESIAECFYFSEDEETFRENIDNLHGTLKAIENNDDPHKHIIDCGSYTIMITYVEDVVMALPDEAKNESFASYSKIEISAVYGKNESIFKENKVYYKYKGV